MPSAGWRRTSPTRRARRRIGPESPDLTGHLNPTEGEKARLDREVIELLNEVRVALPGVQVLFAFLLVLPFQARFAALDELQQHVYAGALLTSAAAVALLITPSSYHRLNFRRPVKERMIRLSSQLLLLGLVFTVVGMTLSVGLVLDVAMGGPIPLLAAALTAAWFCWFWFVMPLMARRASLADEGPEGTEQGDVSRPHARSGRDG